MSKEVVRVKFPSNFHKQIHGKPDLEKLNSPKIDISWIECKEIPNDDQYQQIIEEEDPLNNFFQKSRRLSIFKLKSEFDTLDLNVFRSARNRCNPYELIKSSCFQNRAAVKMASIDKIASIATVFEGIEKPKNETLYFADICSGPGGFSEYLFWRYKDKCKGWGFTIKGDCDFRIDKFNSDALHYSKKNFFINYGKDKTGNIYNSENIKFLAADIDNKTNNKGCDLVMGDGGFTLHGDYNKQEVLSKQIVLTQFLTAMYCLRKGGNFMCKLFDMYHTFSSDLFFILYQHFEKVAIVKPFTSRVANCERYVIAINLKQRRPKICDFLFNINQLFNEKKNVVSIIKEEYIEKDENFKSYFTSSMNYLNSRQELFLKYLVKAVEDESFGFNSIQKELAQKCLEEWNLPLPERKKKRNYYSGPKKYRNNSNRFERTRSGYYSTERRNRNYQYDRNPRKRRRENDDDDGYYQRRNYGYNNKRRKYERREYYDDYDDYRDYDRRRHYEENRRNYGY